MVIPDPVRRAVSKAQKRGVAVTLATGRMFDTTLRFARQLRIQTPLICYQGGLIQAPGADHPLYRATMDADVVREAIAWRKEGPDRDYHMVLYADDALFLAERRYPESFYREMLGKNLHWIDDLAAVLDDHEPVKFLFVADSGRADQIEEAMRQRFGGEVEVVRSHANFVEANPLGVSKGDALSRLADYLGVPQERVMAARAVADWVAPPFSEHGAAVAIERFILSA
jgi:hypothetical protein